MFDNSEKWGHNESFQSVFYKVTLLQEEPKAKDGFQDSKCMMSNSRNILSKAPQSCRKNIKKKTITKAGLDSNYSDSKIYIASKSQIKAEV